MTIAAAIPTRPENDRRTGLRRQRFGPGNQGRSGGRPLARIRIHRIAQPVPRADRWQEPGVAAVERVVGEGAVERTGAGKILAAEDFERGLVAEVAGHGDAAAVAAHGEVQGAAVAHVRQVVAHVR